MLASPLSCGPEPLPALARLDGAPAVWARSAALVDYAEAERIMEARAAAIASGDAPELVWLLEHPPVYTAGVSAQPQDLVDPDRFPVLRVGRGGRMTYHGPGQRVAYVLLDLSRRRKDVRAFVAGLERWLIQALSEFGVRGEIREGRVGVWVDRPDGEGGVCEEKIAAVGVKIRRWVSFHGISLNVAPDLSHFEGIVPCGLSDYGVTSLKALGRASAVDEADEALRRAFEAVFGPAAPGEPPV